MNSVKETLIAARKLIEKKENWVRGFFATDVKGHESEIAMGVKFCALGAILKVDGPFENDAT